MNESPSGAFAFCDGYHLVASTMGDRASRHATFHSFRTRSGEIRFDAVGDYVAYEREEAILGWHAKRV